MESREQTRALYTPFEATLKATSSDVYYHQMPGGQYTNLKFQAQSLGLGDQWEKVKTSYAAANRALGNIVKVWPDSIGMGTSVLECTDSIKVVGRRWWWLCRAPRA